MVQAETTRVSGVLLAAGRASRFGAPKQLARLDGVTLVKRAVEVLRASSVCEIVVVVGQDSERVGRELPSDVLVVLNPLFATGLSSSLKAGIAAVDGQSTAAVVCLADQPMVTPALIDGVIARHRDTGRLVVATSSGEVVGPPVLFHRDIFPEIEALKGDKGAKYVILNHPDSERIEVGPEVLLDIDTPKDLDGAARMISDRPSGR
jgi:molybdenum cofactor cytidylyltransferase